MRVNPTADVLSALSAIREPLDRLPELTLHLARAVLDDGDPAPHLASVASALYWCAADEGLVDPVAVEALVASEGLLAPPNWLPERAFAQLAVGLLELHFCPAIRARCALNALGTAVAWLERIDYPWAE